MGKLHHFPFMGKLTMSIYISMAIFNSYVELPEGIYKCTSSITCFDLRGKTLTADVVNWADDMLQFFSTPDTSRQI